MTSAWHARFKNGHQCPCLQFARYITSASFSPYFSCSYRILGTIGTLLQLVFLSVIYISLAYRSTIVSSITIERWFANCDYAWFMETHWFCGPAPPGNIKCACRARHTLGLGTAMQLLRITQCSANTRTKHASMRAKNHCWYEQRAPFLHSTKLPLE